MYRLLLASGDNQARLSSPPPPPPSWPPIVATELVPAAHPHTQHIPPRPSALAEWYVHTPPPLRQAIVVSGLSGAGKTETCKLVLRHLAYVTKDSLAQVVSR